MPRQNQQSPNHLAFTYKYNGRARQLITDACIESGTSQYPIKTALWDTGATNTCISDNVVKALNLVPTGKGEIHTPSGSKIVNTYLVDIYLPNKVKIAGTVVNGTDIGDQGIDLLVGMDIIALGDFAISQYGGVTTFSFCFPSIRQIDYVKEINIMRTVGPQHGKGKRKR